MTCGLLVAACGLLSCGMRTLSCSMHAESSSPTRDRTRAPGIGSVESYPLDHQGGPCKGILEVNIVQLEEVCVIPLVGSKEDGFPLSVH